MTSHTIREKYILSVYPCDTPLHVCHSTLCIILSVAGAGLEPAILAYETRRITNFHIPLFVVKEGFEPITR